MAMRKSSSRPERRIPKRAVKYFPKNPKRRSLILLKKIKEGKYTPSDMKRHLAVLEAAVDLEPRKINWEYLNQSINYAKLYVTLWRETGRAIHDYFSKFGIEKLNKVDRKDYEDIQRVVKEAEALLVLVNYLENKRL